MEPLDAATLAESSIKIARHQDDVLAALPVLCTTTFHYQKANIFRWSWKIPLLDAAGSVVSSKEQLRIEDRK